MQDLSKRKPRFERSNMPTGLRKSAYIFCALMCIPAVYGIIKYIITNGYSILLAFSDGEPFKSTWSLRNFENFFIDMKVDGTLSICLKNTLIYYAVGLFQTFMSYVIAYFIYKKIPLAKVYRLVLFLPGIISPIIKVAIFKTLIRELGPIWNFVYLLNGKGYLEPLAYPSTATLTIVIYCLLSGFGSTYLIYIGAMNRIPKELLESAALDGCTPWNEFWKIIFPITWGTFSTFLLLSVTTIFTSSGPIMYFTYGAAKTSTLGFWMFSQVRGGIYNYPTAVGLVFTLITVPIVVAVRIVINKIDTGVSY